MPFVRELFSAPTLAPIEQEKRERELVAVPFFDGLMAGESDGCVLERARPPTAGRDGWFASSVSRLRIGRRRCAGSPR